MENKKYIYEIMMGVLALISVSLVALEFSLNSISVKLLNTISIIDNFIYIIFLADYCIRLMISKNKLDFIKSNKIDLLSIIPFNSLFKAFRVLKLIKIIKLTKFIKVSVFLFKLKNNCNTFFKTNHFGYMVVIIIITILLGAFGISCTENIPFSDGLWWSFVTATTVGYGDISPSTGLGRIIASILMLVGIGFIGMLTGTIATYFLSEKENNKSFKEEIIDSIKDKLDNFDDLTNDDISDICAILKSLKNK